MAKAKTLVGLDVHATKIVAAVLDAETGELQVFSMATSSTIDLLEGYEQVHRAGGVVTGSRGFGLRHIQAEHGWTPQDQAATALALGSLPTPIGPGQYRYCLLYTSPSPRDS